MTSKFTRARLEEIRDYDTCVTLEESAELARMALAAMDSEPVIVVGDDGGDALSYRRLIQSFEPGTKLYRHAQLVPVVSADLLHTAASAIEDLLTTKDRTGACVWFDLPFRLRSAANAHSAPVVPDESYQQLSDLYHAQEKRLFKIAQRIKGSAFDKYSHSPSQAIDVLEAAIFGDNDACRAAMLQAQSEDDDGEPTDDERIMAIEGIHNCERCGDEGWIVGEMGITSCACGQAGTLINEGTIQAGNSPVITGAEQRIADAVELLQKAAPAMLADNSGPDGPLAGRLKSPVIPDGSAYMLRRWLAFGRGMQNAGSQLPHNLIAETESMLAAAPKPQNSPQNIPEIIPGWIPVSERMPETDGNYWGWWSESKRQGPVWFIKSELQAQFQSHEITHWMPLPAAPQEVKP